MRKISLSKSIKIEDYFEKNKTSLIGKMIEQNPTLSKINYPKMTKKQWERKLGMMFRRDVEDIYTTTKNIRLDTAIKIELHSTAFVPQVQYFKENLLTRAKKDRQTYNKIKNMFREKGRYGKIDLDAIKYSGKVEYDSDMYSKYEIKTKKGIAYLYAGESPKGKLSNMFFSTVSL